MSANQLTYQPDAATGGTSINTASVAPTTGRVIVVVVAGATADFASFTETHLVTGLGAVWVSRGTIQNTYRRMTVFTTISDGTSGAITLTTVTGLRDMFDWAWCVYEYTEALDALIVNQSASTATGSTTAVNGGTLGTLGSATNPILFAQAAIGDGSRTFTGDTGWTTAIGNSSGRLHVVAGLNDTTPTGTLNSAADWSAIAIEFKLGSSAVTATDTDTGTLTDTGAQVRTGPWYTTTSITISPTVG